MYDFKFFLPPEVKGCTPQKYKTHFGSDKIYCVGV